VSAAALQYAELDHRLEVVAQSQKAYEKVRLTEREALEIYFTILDITLEMMEYNWDHIQGYIKEHSGSSMGQGIPWSEAALITPAQWQELLSIHKDNIRRMRAHPGWSNGIYFYPGIRARADELTTFTTHTSGTLNRSRIILFHPALSQWTLFIVDKQRWYSRIMEKVLQILGFAGEAHFPMVEGGKAYITAQQLFASGKPFKPFDGKSWEASIGSILGPVFNPFLVQTKGIYQLPSGITVTSLLDTIAMAVVVRHIPGIYIILGDDCNYWGKADLTLPFLELQPQDRISRFFLGMSYIDVDRPRISGFKVTKDRADQRQRLSVNEEWQMDSWVGHHSNRERAAQAGLYLGWLFDGTLMDAMSRVKDLRSPGEQIDRLVDEAITNPNLDPFAWAEREGVMYLFA